jgi:hypothetical protein
LVGVSVGVLVGVLVGVGVTTRGPSAPAVVRGLAQLAAGSATFRPVFGLGFDCSEVIDVPANDDRTTTPTTLIASTVIPRILPTGLSGF